MQQGSLAAEAGLQPGDRIVSVDGRQLQSPRQLQAYLGSQLGRQVPIVVQREGRQVTIPLALNQGRLGDTAWLGVFLEDNEPNQNGARVLQVFPAGPAARAGLRPGDVIMQFNGQPVAGSADLIAVVEEQQPRTQAEIVVERGNQPVTLTAVLGSRDSFIGFFQDEQSGGTGSQFRDDDEYGNVPPYAMQMEHDRRMFEQHQRIEDELRKLQEEVRQLREALRPRN